MTYGRRTKRDANQSEIIAALERIGVGVLDLSAVGCGMTDLLCFWRGTMRCLEIKNLAGRGKRLTPAQVDLHAKMLGWGIKVDIVTSVDEALACFGARNSA